MKMGRIKAAKDGPLPEEDVQSPFQPRIKKVSSTDSVLIFCNKQLPLKLFFEGELPVLFEQSSVK